MSHELTASEQIQFRKFALNIRRETIRELHSLGSGHIGGCMSLVETLAVLYGGLLQVDPRRPNWNERDRLIVSKGHAGPAVYAALALRGFFPLEQLETLNRPGTQLPSHTDARKTPGVDMTTGSLGQGVSAGVGIALANKLDRLHNHVYIIAGDGECDEGQVWEAAMFAAAQKLDNLTLIIDRNGYQLDGSTCDVLDLGSMAAKLQAFGWRVICAQNGNDVSEVYKCLAGSCAYEDGIPTAVVMNTVKGKGYPAAEHSHSHHMVITDKDYEEAMQALDKEAELLCTGEVVQNV